MPDYARFFPLISQLPFGALVVARDRQHLRILHANHNFSKWADGRDLTGKPLLDIWPGKHGQDLVRALMKPSLPETMTVNFENYYLKLQFQDISWSGSEACIIWASDITEDKQIEGDLKRAIEEADTAAEMKSNFLATMSHEMRTPMQSVYGLLELIELEKPSRAVEDMLKVAKSSATGLLELLDDILDLAKIDADKMELDVFEVPVRTLARGVLEALSVKVHGKPVELKDEIETDVPFVIVGDPKRLRQILINLTGNALKFTEKGTVKIRVTRKCKYLSPRKKGLNLRFEISDTGIGMSEATLKRLFSSFTQADSSTARKFGGTGLGLSICKKLVEIMDGQIGVESIEGQGSTFWFEIPTDEVSVTSNTLEMPDLNGLSVLSVEDHPQGAKEIMNSLRSMGAAVETCGTIAEARALVHRRPFDVGIIDQGLPDGLGIDLIREIMEMRPFMGLFMYTVRDDVGLQHSLQSLGIKYLAKPASRLGLGQCVLDATQQSKHEKIEGPTRLLIAEDTLSVQDLLKRQLKTLNVEADFVLNGREALQALATGKYGILFSDLHMPEMDGYALVEEIRKKEALSGTHMPVIVLTADVQMAQRQVYLGHGFDECMLKPVTLGHFKRLLMRWGLLKEDSAIETQVKATVQPQNKSSAIDLTALQEQMGAFDDSAKEMLGFFIEMTKPVVAQIEKAQTDQDLHALQGAAHSLKGAARSACANILGDLAARIQDDAESGKDSAETLPLLQQEFARVETAITELVKS